MPVRIVDNLSATPGFPRVPRLTCWYAVSMPATGPSLPDWKPAQLPRPVALYGRTVMVEPLDAELHAADLWERVQGHNAVWQWLFDGPFDTVSAFTADIQAKQAAADRIFYALISAEIGAAAGYASFLRIEPAHGVIEVGNILLSPALQRTTAATEAMYLMARHVFEDLGYRRYEWKCNALNAPSRRAALRLGFTFEGIFRQHMVVKGHNRDTAWFSMLDHEWPARKAAFEAWLDPGNFDADGRQYRKLDEPAPSIRT
ncbi:MAG: GNAT family protein [Terracidiphilus sp.]